MKKVQLTLLILLLAIAPSCLNPFAPKLDTSPAQSSCDPKSIEGVFQCLKVAYAFKDTTVYAPLLDESFVFIYRDYELNVDVTWGRDTELRSSFNLFQNAQRLDLIWNNQIPATTDSTSVNVVRGFNLTITLNPAEIYSISGYANITMNRTSPAAPWKIVRWRDESNF
jgi:hypothetical protein